MPTRAAAVAFLLLGVSAHAADRVADRAFAMRSPAYAMHGMVASAQPLASAIGVDILRAGGNAVDAAIAVNAALGLMEPTGNGVGGDLFALVWDAKTQKLYGLNASGRAGSALTLDDLRARGLKNLPDNGGLPITVPGTVDGWFTLHKRFGKLPMAKVLEPAIRAARDGHPVAPLIAFYWERGLRRFADFPEFQATYAPGGRAPRAGDVFRNPDLAGTLERLARGGRDAFYRGEVAQRIVDAAKKYDGTLTLEDLATHTSTWVDPASTNYRGYDVWELPPNTQGIAALQMLNMLEPQDLAAMGHNSAAALHLMVEVKKIAYEDRARYYVDPDFTKTPLERLLSKDYARERFRLFDPKRAARAIPAGDVALRTGDTTYLTVVDADRNAVSLIQSNYMGFGSGVVPAGLGFCLQNRGRLFNLDPAHANAYAPRKRPFHTIIPAFVTRDGKPVFSFGVMGGDVQPQGHVQVLVNLIDFGMNVQEAGDAPRFHHEGSSEPTGEVMQDGGVLHLESGIAPEVVRDLALMGHRITASVGTYGGYQGIWIDHERGVLIGATESRKDGCALGYSNRWSDVGAEEYNGTFIGVRRPHDDLMVFRIRPDAPIPPYEAGQWISIGVGMWEPRVKGLAPESLADEERVKLVRRPLSISSSILVDDGNTLLRPEDETWYELYATFPRAAAPAFTARLFALEPEARMWIADAPRGQNTLAPVQPDDDVLFAATGTGEAPHNRMIWELLRRGHRGRIASFASTRQRIDQAYRGMHERLMRLYPSYRHIAVVTGEKMPRLQALLRSGELEERADFALDPSRARVFLCGNPAMVGAPRLQDGSRVFTHQGGMVELLEQRGFHCDPESGTLNIHFERY